MTLDEEIRHCEEVAENYRYQRDDAADINDVGTASDCQNCADEHEQLASWLRELKELREENKVLISECDRLIKEKGQLLKQQEQIGEYKRLLKAAVDAINELLDCGAACSGSYCDKYCVYSCETCPLNEAEGTNGCSEWRKWKHADEALALIGEEKTE